MSVLCGVHTSLFGRQRITPDFVCVNLDKNTVMYGGTELPDAGLKDMPMLQERVRRKVEANLKKAVGEMHRDFDPSSADSCLSEMNYLFKRETIDSIPDTFFHRRNSDLDYTGTMFEHENEEENETTTRMRKRKTKQKMRTRLKTTCSPLCVSRVALQHTTKFTS